MLRRRFLVAISACLLGEPVRYNGKHKHQEWLLAALGDKVRWVPLCPEASLGIPREPMRLERSADGVVRAICVQSRSDRTHAIKRYARLKALELKKLGVCACLLKARSPSCAVRDAKIYLSGRKMPCRGPGLLTRELRRHLPLLRCFDEKELHDKRRLSRFIAQLSCTLEGCRPHPHKKALPPLAHNSLF